MTHGSQELMHDLVMQLEQNPGLVAGLPSHEGEIVRSALQGQSVYSIAQQSGISEEAVWQVLSTAARAASGQSVQQVETGGLGSDTDPGVTGGYGDTGFGSLGSEEPGEMFIGPID